MGGLTDWPRAVAGRTPAAKERRSLAQRSDLLIVPHSVIANRLRVPRYVPAGRWCHPDKSIRSCMPSVRPPLALASEIGWVKTALAGCVAAGPARAAAGLSKQATRETVAGYWV